ncbi:hypothetical protein AAF712_008933 [Marasmius tenuissimus]|uniref:Uncharacterized protein n=1 Tax=Marasmius tenuissimus TaxID=585030 RepID=A0ABR2ZT99_9AGAR
MSLYNLSPAVSSTLSLASTSSTPEAILTMYANTQFDFTAPPSGAALPLPGPRRARVGSFSEQRGFKYDFTIKIDLAKPIGEVKIAKGDLEPRAGALPRRVKKKAQPQPPQVHKPVEINEKMEFELFATAGME